VEHKNILKYLDIVLGMIIIALSFNLLIYPLKIVIGGTNGIALIMNELTGFNINLFIALFYILMFIIAIILFGIKDSKNMILGTILYPLFMEIFSSVTKYIEIDYSNKLILYLAGAVGIGVGTGLIFRHGYMTGGTDILKKILNQKLHIPLGTSGLIIDGLIVITGGFIFGINSVLYAIIILYISSKITDKMILGISTRKMFYIMTKKPKEVRSCIEQEIKTGITEIDAIGGYTEDKYHVLMCVTTTKDYIKLKERIDEIDENSFFVITDSYHMYYHGM